MMRFVQILLLLCTAFSLLSSQSTISPADEVNPFIGTAGHGHTFPGATRPFGMVQLSPDTRVEGWDACGGYHYSDSLILGFSHTHLSGTGIGDYGDLLLMPLVGLIPAESGSAARRGYRSGFRHETEKATPGFYSVLLDDSNINAELTASQRVGFHRYTFPRTDSAFLILDLIHGIGPDQVTGANLEFVSDREVVGSRRSKGWAEDQLVFFVLQTSKPFMAHAIEIQDRVEWGSPGGAGTALRALLMFSTLEKEKILVKVALSSVGVDGARRNLEADIPHWDFGRVRSEARDEWNRALGKIEIEGGSLAQRTIFYTALYHTMIAPNIFSDADGRYRGLDKRIHLAKGYHRYTVFSLWDTFRSAHPLYTILEPARTVDFIKSFLSQYDEGGFLPVWELAANETWTMIGYHSVSVIADAYTKGLRGFEVRKALDAMKKSAVADHFGLKDYRRLGYIPGDRESESVSRTLEYAYDDWCIAQMALDLKREKEHEEFSRRAQSYKNLFDPSTGFMRGKRNGNWVRPFSPYAVTNDYTEANAWQYTFFVPHDVNGLIDLMGGKEFFVQRLDSLFTAPPHLEGRQQADITGLIGQYAHGNEPSHHMAYLYNYAGAPWKAQELVRRIMGELYTEHPDGLSGNEDCGQMSAWYVLSAMGFFQVNPGQPMYCLGSPLFDRTTVNLKNGRKFTITARNNSSENKYVQSVTLNGNPLRKSFIMHSEVLHAGELVFEMGPEPGRGWGVKTEDCPRSPQPAAYVPVPVISGGTSSFEESTHVSLTSVTPGASLFYRTETDRTWKKYEEPFTIRSDTKVFARAAKNQIESQIAEAMFKKFRRIGTIKLATAYSQQYTGGGDDALVDGIRGVEDFRVGGWQGYEENDLEAVIDLGSVKKLREISVSFLQDTNVWIFFPQNIRYEISEDGTAYRLFFEGATGIPPEKTGAMVKTVAASGSAVARHVRIRASNIGRCPPWHKGAGGKAWLFVDEVEIQ